MLASGTSTCKYFLIHFIKDIICIIEFKIDVLETSWGSMLMESNSFIYPICIVYGCCFSCKMSDILRQVPPRRWPLLATTGSQTEGPTHHAHACQKRRQPRSHARLSTIPRVAWDSGNESKQSNRQRTNFREFNCSARSLPV